MECELKGYLSYLILWIINKQKMNGAEIIRELENRRGSKPSCGTVYPSLKDLKNKELVKINENKQYSLTPKGKKELKEECQFFSNIFYDSEEMKKFCK